MASTSSRTLQLLSLLQSQRYWPGADLADRLEVSVRTLRRDVERLRELGYPVQAARGVAGGYSLAPGAALPPLVLDDEEAVALAVGLSAATTSAVAGMAEASVRALTKVVQVMPGRLRHRVEALRAVTVQSGWATSAASIPPDVLTTVAQACRDDERLAFAYSAADGARSRRTVEPHRLVPLGRRWYLVAYDLDRHDWRSFRLDRLTGPAPTGERFRQRTLPAPDAATFVRRGTRDLPTSFDVEAVVQAPVDVVLTRLGHWATAEDAGEGATRLRMRTDSLDWAALALGSVGAEFRVVRPDELVVHLAGWAERFTRAVS
jgi:predicted DNA-binding transcriptional regulator YafY